MKILFVLGSFFPAQCGGPSNTIYWQAKSLVEEGHDVTVATLEVGINEELQDQYSIEFNRVHNLDGMKVYYFEYQTSPYLCCRLFRWLWKNVAEFELISLTSVFFPITWLAAVVSKIHGVPFCIAPRGELEEGALRYRSLKKKLFWACGLRWLFSRAHFVMVTCQQERIQCERYFAAGMAIRLLPNFIDLTARKLRPDEIANKSGVLFLGRLHPIKAVDSLISAFGMLPEALARTNPLTIAGSGEETVERKLREQATHSPRAQYIRFIGHLDGPVKDEEYASSRVFVLPSHSENFGNVVLEALCQSTPVVASVHTPWRQLESANCGAWVKNDPGTLARTLEAILSLRGDDYAELAREAYKLAESFSIQKNRESISRAFCITLTSAQEGTVRSEDASRLE